MAQRRVYTDEFKHDAVRLVTEQGYNAAEAARNLGINANMLRRWQPQSVRYHRFFGRSDRPFTGGTDPVKKHGPGMSADLRLVMPLGNPV